MGGWSRGLRAPPSEISIVALMLAAGMSAANAQHALDPITVLATKTVEKAIEALAMVSSVRQEQLDQIQPKRVAKYSTACRASGTASAPTRPKLARPAARNRVSFARHHLQGWAEDSLRRMM